MNRTALRHALAGFHAGMLGAILMVMCLMLGSWLNRRSIWLLPNLFGTTFYGSQAYRNGFIKATWSGVALILATYSICGVAWGLIYGERRRLLGLLYGAGFGLAVYYFFFSLFWKHLNPALALYAPTRQLQIAHVLWGMMLARSPRYAAQLSSGPAIPFPAER